VSSFRCLAASSSGSPSQGCNPSRAATKVKSRDVV
jgi:hypothetical protein